MKFAWFLSIWFETIIFSRMVEESECLNLNRFNCIKSFDIAFYENEEKKTANIEWNMEYSKIHLRVIIKNWYQNQYEHNNADEYYIL